MKWIDLITTPLGLVGTIDTLILVIIICRSSLRWLRGISPVLYRLGNGLANRKVAIFANGDNRASLKSLLLDSGLFQDKSICEISSPRDIGKCEEASVFLVYWPDWATHIDDVLNAKPDKCALVVYAPYDSERIPTDRMKLLDGKRHTAVTNFRGRLLNDIVASMITTGYEKGRA